MVRTRELAIIRTGGVEYPFRKHISGFFLPSAVPVAIDKFCVFLKFCVTVLQFFALREANLFVTKRRRKAWNIAQL